MEDLVRRCCSGRDAQSRQHAIGEDIRVSCIEASLPEDLETSEHVFRMTQTTYALFRGELQLDATRVLVVLSVLA